MNIVNKISIGRILLIPFFIGSIVYYQAESRLAPYLPLLIFMIAVISDGLDGFIARRFGQKTELGTILDPIADKLLIITAFVCLAFSKNIPQSLKLPPWIPILVISRDVIIVLGSIIIYLIKGNIKIQPTLLGKVTTFFQMATILSVLIRFPYAFIIWNLAAAFTVLSGINYIGRGSKLLNENNG